MLQQPYSHDEEFEKETFFFCSLYSADIKLGALKKIFNSYNSFYCAFYLNC